MTHKSSARIAGVVCLLSGCSLLVSCGGDGGSGGWDGNGGEGGDYGADPNAAVLVGVGGVAWSAVNTHTDGSTTTATGVTNDAGKFDVASKSTCTTTTDNQGKQTTTCSYSGFEAPRLSIGGNPLPSLPIPDQGYASARYTLMDFGAAAYNVAAFVLMGKSNPGDPLLNGIQLSTGFSSTDCPSFDWNTPNIEQDAACFLTQANKDGVQHSWPTADTVNQFLRSQWLHAKAGYYSGWQANTATSAYPTARTLTGNSDAIVAVDGTTEGWLDYTGSKPPSDLPAVSWSGTLAPTTGQGDSLTYTTDGAAPIPNLMVAFDVDRYGANIAYQTADGTLAGTGDPRMGLGRMPAIDFPKYHFLLKNVSYTRPGQTSPDNYVLRLEIGYGSYVEGELNSWPPLPSGTSPPMWLDLYGQLNKDNTVTLHWFSDTITKKGPASNSTMTLTFDPTAVTLSGDLVGYDGRAWTTITIQGWRT